MMFQSSVMALSESYNYSSNMFYTKLHNILANMDIKITIQLNPLLMEVELW